ncbi:hypothetical protein AAC387_Pa05g3901 [Persea americana]
MEMEKRRQKQSSMKILMSLTMTRTPRLRTVDSSSLWPPKKKLCQTVTKFERMELSLQQTVVARKFQTRARREKKELLSPLWKKKFQTAVNVRCERRMLLRRPKKRKFQFQTVSGKKRKAPWPLLMKMMTSSKQQQLRRRKTRQAWMKRGRRLKKLRRWKRIERKQKCQRGATKKNLRMMVVLRNWMQTQS